MNEIELNQLHAESDNLDELTCDIDKWVNKIKKRCKESSCDTHMIPFA